MPERSLLTWLTFPFRPISIFSPGGIVNWYFDRDQTPISLRGEQVYIDSVSNWISSYALSFHSEWKLLSGEMHAPGRPIAPSLRFSPMVPHLSSWIRLWLNIDQGVDGQEKHVNKWAPNLLLNHRLLVIENHWKKFHENYTYSRDKWWW